MYNINYFEWGGFLRDPVYEIKEHLGVIREGENGMRREVNIISWNGESLKYDIRCWSEDREHYSRGFTMFPVEMELFIKMIEKYMEKS